MILSTQSSLELNRLLETVEGLADGPRDELIRWISRAADLLRSIREDDEILAAIETVDIQMTIEGER